MSRKKYFFFNSGAKEEDMGRKKNKHRNKNKNKPTIQKNETKTFGFGQYVGPESGSGTEFGYDDHEPYGSPSYDQCSYTSTQSNFYHNAYKKQDAVDPERVVSTDQGFLEVHHSDAWGSTLVPVDDPKSIKVTLEELNGIKLIDNFPKIPAALWSRWTKLALYFCERQEEAKNTKPRLSKTWNHEIRGYDYYRHFGDEKVKIEDPEKVLGPGAKFGGIDCEYTSSISTPRYQSDLEVSVLLCRKADDLNQWKILVPKQTVSHSSVRAETKDSIDIETGEVYDIFPPIGWLHAGSSHSHNSFGPFFSSTDDDSELTVPGLHIVIGNIRPVAKTYEPKASVVLRRLRKHVNFKDVVDDTPDLDVTFHANVLEYVSKFTTSPVITPWGSHSQTPAGGLGRSVYRDGKLEDLTKIETVVETEEETVNDWPTTREDWLDEFRKHYRHDDHDISHRHTSHYPTMDPRQDPDEYCGWC